MGGNPEEGSHENPAMPVPDLRLPASETVRNKPLWSVYYPVCGTLLDQHRLTKIITEDLSLPLNFGPEVPLASPKPGPVLDDCMFFPQEAHT